LCAWYALPMVDVGIRVRLGMLCALASVAVSREAPACGGGGLTTSDSNGVVADAQRIFMSVRGGRTDVVVQIGVPATSADYGVLIPVPGEPTLVLQPVSEDDLVSLDTATAPTIRRIDRSGSSLSSGCGCGSDAAAVGDDTKGGDRSDGVSVTEPVNIGPIAAVVLTGTNGDAVNGWLAENGFVVPDAEQATIDAYSGDERYFIAVRRSDTAAPGSPSSVGLHYSLAGDHRMVSLGFARLGAAASVAFTLFLSAPGTVGATEPFETLSLEDLSGSLLRQGAAYRTAVAEAVADRGSRAFVLESATSSAALAPQLTPRMANLLAPGSTVTRLSTVVAADALTDDATFTTPYVHSVPGERYVSVNVSRAYAGFGTAIGIALLGALRRRPRRTSTATV
jgi:hypothetical protein